ncbi:SET domain-containing protein-lysine N-methyltransferase [Horticoccus sp. 23ND18S-11]|uniref:SET domain-containing protein-lysine N-methyltransferase n=1 Tax=Horticoccus sp. 23ND18S-11 TaxID=3391832 RepID=UPI0039C93FE7
MQQPDPVRRGLRNAKQPDPVRPAPHEGVYARIGPSRIHGVGVRAIRAIPARALVFQGESPQVAWVSRAAVRRLPKAIRALYEDFGMVSGNLLGVPPNLNRLSVGWYINHSPRPNVVAGDDGRFRTLRRIRRGEELTADYRTYVDEPLPFRPKSARQSVPRSARLARNSSSPASHHVGYSHPLR